MGAGLFDFAYGEGATFASVFGARIAHIAIENDTLIFLQICGVLGTVLNACRVILTLTVLVKRMIDGQYSMALKTKLISDGTNFGSAICFFGCYFNILLMTFVPNITDGIYPLFQLGAACYNFGIVFLVNFFINLALQMGAFDGLYRTMLQATRIMLSLSVFVIGFVFFASTVAAHHVNGITVILPSFAVQGLTSLAAAIGLALQGVVFKLTAKEYYKKTDSLMNSKPKSSSRDPSIVQASVLAETESSGNQMVTIIRPRDAANTADPLKTQLPVKSGPPTPISAPTTNSETSSSQGIHSMANNAKKKILKKETVLDIFKRVDMIGTHFMILSVIYLVNIVG